VKIGLVDYGGGNLRSVHNAVHALGHEPVVIADPGGLADATHLILPGQGEFGDVMTRLAARDLVEPLREWITAGRPYFGICVGYQILFEESEETPGVSGLGIFAGKVRRFQEQPGLKIPHMGWNSVSPTTPESGCWKGLGAEPYFYYVHSYFPVPADPSIIAATTSYGADTFAGAVQSGAIFACQFHPEKSQNAGIRLLRNFFEA
jgi:imidazole glycerol phosphate synthase glutamine amidotransferase subunit